MKRPPRGRNLMQRSRYRISIPLLIVVAYSVSSRVLLSQTPCKVSFPTASFSVHHMSGDPKLSIDSSSSAIWKAATALIFKDCTRTIDYPDLKTEVRGFWTDTHLYLLFRCPYRSLNLFLPAQPGRDRDKLWDRDVVEMFLGDDWEHIRQYREYEIAATVDWVDLVIDLHKEGNSEAWNSGWQTQARIDERARIWYAAARIPLASVSSSKVTQGTRW